MAIRDWFRINWKSWKFWLAILVAEYILSILVGSRSLIGSIFYYIFAGFGYGLSFVPNFLWSILGIFLFFKFRRLIGKIMGGTGTVMQHLPFLGWAGRILSSFGGIIGKGKSAQWQKLRGRYKGVRGAYILNAIADTTKVIFTKIGFLRTHFMKLRNIPGREPEIIFRNRLLFMRLLDQNLRFEIFYKKSMYVNEYTELLKNRTEQLKSFIDQVVLKKQIILLRSQKGKINLGTKTEPMWIGDDLDPTTSLPGYETFKGWNYVNKIIVYYMIHLYEFFTQKLSELERIPREGRMQYYSEFGQECNRKLSNDISRIKSPIDASRGEYDIRAEKDPETNMMLYAHHYIIKAHTLWLWDMFNASGKGYHPYRFAKKGAEYVFVDKTGAIITAKTLGPVAKVINDTTEVNVYGEFADDVRNDVWPRRRLKNPRRDSSPFPPGEDMGKIAEKYGRDWTGFIRDFREGIYHWHSRNVQEYLDAWDQGIWKDDDITSLPKGGQASFAFDLRVLADPGIYTWWGREKYDDPAETVRTGNPEPHISQYGIRIFIKRLIERTSARAKETKDFLANYYPFDTKEEPKTVKEMDRKPVIGPYEEKVGD